MPDALPTARDLARASITTSIVGAARERLTAEGPAQLSLRAVARDVGMVSSAVYRYFPSRDDLLTALLVIAYDELGAAVEAADAAQERSEVGERWLAACRAIRSWSIDHPGDFALLFGTPVPGYAAPQETVEPASRVIAVLVAIVVDAATACGTRAPTSPSAPTAGVDPVGETVASAVQWTRDRMLHDDAPVELVVRTLMAWTTVIGTVSFESFGHFVGSVDDTTSYFDHVVARLADDLGFAVALT